MWVLQVSEVHRVFQVRTALQAHEVLLAQKVSAVLPVRTARRVLLVSQVTVMTVHEVTQVPQLLLHSFPQPLPPRA